MKTTDNLLAWRAFLVVAETGSVSKASIILDMEFSGLSRILSLFEKELGFALFDRQTRPWKLTKKGEELRPEAIKILRHVDTALKKAENFEPRVRTIRFSLPVNMTRRNLFSLLEGYKKDNPFIDFQIVNDATYLEVLDGVVDVAFLGYEPEHPNLLYWHGGYGINMLLCTPQYLKTRKVPRTPEDLKNHDLILRSSFYLPVTTHLFHGDQKVRLQGKMHYVGDTYSCKMAVLSHHGIGIDLSVAYCENEIEMGLLQPVLLGWHRARWDVFITINKNKSDDAELVKFARWFAHEQKLAYPNQWQPIYKKFGVTP